MDGKVLLEKLRATGLQVDAWWPADVATPLARLVGGVLVQRTTWAAHAYPALQNLLAAGALRDATTLLALPEATLTEMIRCAGFYTTKPRAVRAISQWWLEHKDDHSQMSDEVLRKSLDAVYGIGPESADLALISVFNRGTFVADKYARRLFTAAGLEAPKGYEPFHTYAMTLCDGLSHVEFQELHSLKVEYGKLVSVKKVTYSELFLQ